MTHQPIKLYTDAGLLSGGNSTLGGAWAFRWVGHEDHVILERSGLMFPGNFSIPHVEINLVETYAVLLALESVDDGWSGDVFCDNQNAKKRFTEPSKWGGVPTQIRERCHQALKRLGKLSFTLLAGHPTPEDLEQGFRTRDSGNRYPVSIHNVACDHLCEAEIKRWKDARKEETKQAIHALLVARLGTAYPAGDYVVLGQPVRVAKNGKLTLYPSKFVTTAATAI